MDYIRWNKEIILDWKNNGYNGKPVLGFDYLIDSDGNGPFIDLTDQEYSKPYEYERNFYATLVDIDEETQRGLGIKLSESGYGDGWDIIADYVFDDDMDDDNPIKKLLQLPT